MDIRQVRTRWINVESAKERNEAMVSLLDQLGFEDAERFNAVTKHGNGPRENTANCGESHIALLHDTILKDGKPVLVLEDDVDVEHPFRPIVNFPDDAECVYLGTSHGSLEYRAIDVGDGWLRVEKMYSTHAVLHVNPEYCADFIRVSRAWIERLAPFDVGIAYMLQTRRRVYAPQHPIFYQSDAKNSMNKWERLTRIPLRVTA